MKRAAIFTSVLLVLLVARIAPAQTGGRASSSMGYDVTWSSVDGGGGMSGDGLYTLNGSIGQPDVGTLTGAGYTLIGGFWGSRAAPYRIYLPLVLKH